MTFHSTLNINQRRRNLHPQEVAAIFTTDPQQKQTQDIIEEIAISLNLAEKLRRPIDHGYFSKLSG